MTKKELVKCEEACKQAIRELEQSKEYFKEYESIFGDAYHQVGVALRKADNKQGHAEGIYQALVMVGYKSKSMEKLSKMI